MMTCVEGVRVFLVALKKRPVMVTDNIRVGDNPVSTVNLRLKTRGESRTKVSLPFP